MVRKLTQSIASQSLGRAWNHRIESKLAACAQHGFEAIEIFMEDLDYAAQPLSSSWLVAAAGTSFIGSTHWNEQQLAAAQYIRSRCEYYGLAIICLQPFMHYEGLIDRDAHVNRINELKVWMQIARELGTDLIQIPSSFLSERECTADRSVIIRDLREVAELGLSKSPPMRFAYEALCWATHVDKWYDAWDIVKAVEMPNFGTCLDTFNMLGRIYADPTTQSGHALDAEENLAATIERLRRDVDIQKVFYVEVEDGERLSEPLTPTHEWHVEGQNPRMTWSRNARLFPFEKNGYLPVMEILETILDLGYQGYIAFEIFSRTANAADANVPRDHARRGQISWAKMMRYLEEREAEKNVADEAGMVKGADKDDHRDSGYSSAADESPS